MTDQTFDDAVDMAYEGDYEPARVFILNHQHDRPEQAKRVAQAVFFAYGEALKAMRGKGAVAKFREERKHDAVIWHTYVELCARDGDVTPIVREVEENRYFEQKCAALSFAADRLSAKYPALAIVLLEAAQRHSPSADSFAYDAGPTWASASKNLGARPPHDLVRLMRAEAERRLAALASDDPERKWRVQAIEFRLRLASELS